MRLPWHRQRVLRDFVEALGISLDADVPEAEAVMLAAESTGSVVLQELAGRVVGDLQVGQKLVAALERIDSTGR